MAAEPPHGEISVWEVSQLKLVSLLLPPSVLFFLPPTLPPFVPFAVEVLRFWRGLCVWTPGPPLALFYAALCSCPNRSKINEPASRRTGSSALTNTPRSQKQPTHARSAYTHTHALSLSHRFSCFPLCSSVHLLAASCSCGAAATKAAPATWLQWTVVVRCLGSEVRFTSCYMMVVKWLMSDQKILKQQRRLN